MQTTKEPRSASDRRPDIRATGRREMMTYELDDIEKAALFSTVIQRARADLNEGRPLTEMRQETQCADCFAWVKRDDPHTCKQQIRRNQRQGANDAR